VLLAVLWVLCAHTEGAVVTAATQTFNVRPAIDEGLVSIAPIKQRWHQNLPPQSAGERFAYFMYDLEHEFGKRGHELAVELDRIVGELLAEEADEAVALPTP
jgi:hypothetical protein